MRSLLARALVASALASATAEQPVADETALLQTMADPASESHLGMPKLHCDMSTGCRYEGLPERPRKPAAPMFPSFLPPVDPATLQKLMEGIKLPDPAKIQAELAKVKLPDLAQLIKNAPKPAPGAPTPAWQMPDLAKMVKDAAKAMPQQPDFSKMLQDAAKLAPPSGQQAHPALQIPDFGKIMQEAAKFMPNAATQNQQAPQPAVKKIDFTKIAEALAKLKPPAPAVSALQVSGAEVTETATAYFIPDNGMVCVQGSEEYVTKGLAKLKASPLGAGYQAAAVTRGSCADQQYADGPMPDKCLPKATLFMSKAHLLQPFSEPLLVAKYALKHGKEAAKQGMADLCKED